MQKINKNQDKQKQAGFLGDWHGLGNEPRNENLARIRGPGSFERQEIAREGFQEITRGQFGNLKRTKTFKTSP